MDRAYRLTARRATLPTFLLLLSLLVSAAGCGSDPAGPGPSAHERGDIISATLRSSFTLPQLQQILSGTGASLPMPLAHAVDAYFVTYQTVDAAGNVLVVSGGLILPAGADNLPLLSIQHGTVSRRTQVASSSPLLTIEGVLGLLLASTGYLVAAPDYPGFGVSDIAHPYMHADSLVPSVVDLLRAARHHADDKGISLDGTLYLTGYSEGGYVTLVAQKAIEEEYGAEFTPTAVAPLSGPYDLIGTMETMFAAGDYISPAYIAYLLTAYDRLYGWGRLDEMFQEPWASDLPGLFDGSMSWVEVVNALPGTFGQLLDAGFVADVVSGTESDVVAAFTENTLLDWSPVAPIHFFHGTDDEVVPYQNALTAESRLDAQGATSIQVTAIPGTNHETAGPLAVAGAIQWFEFIRSGGTTSSKG